MLARDRSLLGLRTSQGEYAEKPPSSYHIYEWTIGGNLTPMQVAAKFGSDNVLAVMEEFATPGQRLLVACHRGDAIAARGIAAAHPGIVGKLELADQRALTDAAWAANSPAVEIMLELGFDPSIPGISGATGGNALHCAAWQGSVPCVTALLQHDRGKRLINTRERAHNGTPLGWCCHGSINCGNPRANHGEVARLLIGAGATLDPEMVEWGCGRGMQSVIEEALTI
jgi:hypothetical protein